VLAQSAANAALSAGVDEAERRLVQRMLNKVGGKASALWLSMDLGAFAPRGIEGESEKRVHHLWRREGLKVPQEARKKREVVAGTRSSRAGLRFQF
jgi:hypothetical protein